MKLDNLRQLVKEELKKTLNEEYQDKYKMVGMLVSNINIEVIDGINLFFVNENLASGIYYIKINNKSYSTKVIKHIIH
jgi:hypothetical protein